MKIFLLDLWHDLREKRLWPVAVLLVAGLAAVPLVLAKPATEPPPAAPSAPESARDSDLKGLAKVVLAEDKASNGSKLNLFDSNDPFHPPASARKKDEDNTPSAPSGSEQTAGGGIAEGTGGGTPSFGGGGGTGGGGVTPTPTQPTQPKTKTTKFTYVIDATFVHGNHTRKIKGFQRLEMLPNQDSPLLVFLGVDAKADNAVFLVDARLTATGEGNCKPSDDECSFLYLGAGSQELFTIEDTGDSYGLRIDQIRRVEVGAKKSSAGGSNDKKQKNQNQAAKNGSRAHASSQEPFVPPLLTDLVTETADSYEGSRPSGDSR
jgi:hypothetical protein